MAVRDKLIELIQNAVNGCARHWAEIIADHLLANGVVVLDTGVISPRNRPLISQCFGRPLDEIIELMRAKDEGRLIVPPCKVGDKVYEVDGTTDGVCEGKVTNLEYNIYTTPMEWITIKVKYPFFGELESKHRIDLVLGKTVFLTKEEAEAKLKEREGNG